MAVNLKRDAKNVNIDAPEYQPLLKNLQANILRAHGRNNVRHLFIAFTGGQAAARTWLKTSAPKITTARQQYDQIKAREDKTKIDGGTIFNLYLSAAGYSALGLNPDQFDSDSYERGMKRPTGGKDPKPATWEAQFRGEIHAMVAVADSNAATADSEAQKVANSLAGIGSVLAIQKGTVLRRQIAEDKFEPIEHFGYFDGISNPIFTKRDLDAEKEKFTIGNKWDPTASLSLVLRDDPFTNVEDAYGSFLVYRKLHQDVGLFNQRLTALAAAIPQSEELAGAMLVGRFKDGTPVAEAKVPTDDFSVSNDFNYKGDEAAFRCPAHAHIRKVNPREQVGLVPEIFAGDGRKRRIVRRGVPYGEPVPALGGGGAPSADRGLLFLCFQANIKSQFEFIQRSWVDEPRFPKGLLPGEKKTGYDPLISQASDQGQRWPKVWGSEAAGRDRISFESAVTLKGGEYFFAPSIVFLQSLS